MFISYQNYKGGINNLVVVESDGIVTTSLKDKETAIRNHKKKLNKLNVPKLTLIDKSNMAHKKASEGNYTITDKKDNKQYKYGENPYMDMQIHNCVYVDMFPEEVEDKTNFYGFNRDNYILEQ